jgi:hypothetical protein
LAKNEHQILLAENKTEHSASEREIACLAHLWRSSLSHSRFSAASDFIFLLFSEATPLAISLS